MIADADADRCHRCNDRKPMASTVAVLYVERDGCYAGEPTQLGFPWDRPWLADVDPWDESRDARRYSGPHPVVAHPPCRPVGEEP